MATKRGAKRGRLSAQGDISFHATFDQQAFRLAHEKTPNTVNASAEVIHVGEVVFTKLGPSSASMRKVRARPGGATISVSAAVPSGLGDDQFPSDIKYVGVAKTKIVVGQSPAEQRFVVQCGGLATIRLPEVHLSKAQELYCVGDLLCCKLVSSPGPGDNAELQRAGLTTDHATGSGKLQRGDSSYPIIGRCLGNGRSGDTMDVILSANAPGLYCA